MTRLPYDDPVLYDLRTAHLTDDLGLFVREAARSGEPVLELGCGTGRVALHLARKGFRVVGLELDPAMLARARDKARAAGLAPALVRGDMTRFAFRRAFRTVCIAFASLHDLPALADWERALRCAHAALAPGGRLVFDDHAPAGGGGSGKSGTFDLHDPATRLAAAVRHTIVADPRTQTTRGEIAYRISRRDGTREERFYPFEGSWAEKSEVEAMLGAAGFREVEIQGDYTGTAWHPGCPQTIFLARA